ncbi:MAG: hypothetical protein HYZ08_01270, partial [Candidatus Kerfeldbacteria bacterium]|nr:hypothetical protein [Candidatus Kerfeldbacteria bacterium]
KALEDEGYLSQPHPSAGRVLTEKGFRYYLSLLGKLELPKNHLQKLEHILRHVDDTVAQTKTMALYLAETTEEAVFVGWDSFSSYYTGLSNLFRKPEFASHDMVVNISEVVDHFDQVLETFHRTLVIGEVRVLLGKENPFDPMCSTVVGKTSEHQLIGILGPLRMPYRLTIPFIQKTIDLLRHGHEEDREAGR